MKKLILPVLILCSIPVFGARIENATCSDYATVSNTVTSRYLAFMDGYSKAGGEVIGPVDMGTFISESQKLDEQCLKNLNLKLSTLQKRMNKPETKATGNAISPLIARCEDFIALDKAARPVAAFWIAGYRRAGKIQSGVIGEDFLERPLLTLIEDCQEQPGASLYSKTKTWLQRAL